MCGCWLLLRGLTDCLPVAGHPMGQDRVHGLGQTRRQACRRGPRRFGESVCANPTRVRVLPAPVVLTTRFDRSNSKLQAPHLIMSIIGCDYSKGAKGRFLLLCSVLIRTQVSARARLRRHLSNVQKSRLWTRCECGSLLFSFLLRSLRKR